MLTVSIILFFCAAVIGFIMAVRIYKNKNNPMAVSLTHGFFAAAGLALLILFTTGEPIHSTLTSIVLFSIAAIGGVVLFARDMMNKSLPKPLVIVHAGIALLSFAILLVAAFS